eukprot:6599452-Pyramimonas_sp.AAC.2
MCLWMTADRSLYLHDVTCDMHSPTLNRDDRSDSTTVTAGNAGHVGPHANVILAARLRSWISRVHDRTSQKQVLDTSVRIAAAREGCR